MRLKPGVSLENLAPQMALAALIVDQCYQRAGAVCTITSVNDSKHMSGSLHYSGLALDFRTRDLTAPMAVRDDVATCLGPQVEVIFDRDHLHVEYDP